jgi:hypothetical protein
MNTGITFIMVLILYFSQMFVNVNKDHKPDAFTGPTRQPSQKHIEVFLVLTDYNTGKPLGIRQYNFLKPLADSTAHIPVEISHSTAGDFGDLSIKLKGTADTLFAGDIIWMGTGQMRLPASLDTSQLGTSNGVSLTKPAKIDYFDGSGSPTRDKNFIAKTAAVWEQIRKVDGLATFAADKFRLGYCLYTPRVGGTDYSVARWIVFLVRDYDSSGAW